MVLAASAAPAESAAAEATSRTMKATTNGEPQFVLKYCLARLESDVSALLELGLWHRK